MIYKTLIQPHFAYCATIVFQSNVTGLRRMQILQNKCILKVDRMTNECLMSKCLEVVSVRPNITYYSLLFI